MINSDQDHCHSGFLAGRQLFFSKAERKMVGDRFFGNKIQNCPDLSLDRLNNKYK
jgi:hypothetical protein